MFYFNAIFQVLGEAIPNLFSVEKITIVKTKWFLRLGVPETSSLTVDKKGSSLGTYTFC